MMNIAMPRQKSIRTSRARFGGPEGGGALADAPADAAAPEAVCGEAVSAVIG